MVNIYIKIFKLNTKQLDEGRLSFIFRHRLLIGLLQHLLIHMCIDLGRRYAAMSKELLYYPDVGPSL